MKQSKSHLLRNAAILLLATCANGAMSSADPVPVTVPPLDQKQPLMPGVGPVATQSPDSGGGDMCWAAPNPKEKVMTGAFGATSGHKSNPHAGNDLRGQVMTPLYSVADGCVSFGNPTARQLVGMKIRINDIFPNSSVWYLHMNRVAPKFINDGRQKLCIPVKKGELIGYAGNSWGTGGAVKDIVNTHHLHLSYYSSGLLLNPLPMNKVPAGVDARYHQIKGQEALTGGKDMNDTNSSGTAGSKLGFGVPRMCDTYDLKNSTIKSIPYKPGIGGLGFYTAQAKAPTQEELEANAKKVREAVGVTNEGATPPEVKINPDTWTGGSPQEPDWDSYADMSFLQIIQSEVSRRSTNQRWAEELAEQSPRGLLMEDMRLRALRQQVQYELYLSRQRTETMLATLLLADANKMKMPMQRIVDQGLGSPVK